MLRASPSREKSHTTKLFGVFAVLVLVVLVPISFYIWLVTLDLRGTFINTADLADLDGDGDLDVILHNLRNESETVAFGGTTLWINQGEGQFSTGSIELPQLPPYLYISVVGGDVDRDGDADLLFLTPNRLWPVLNQSGEKVVFKVNDPILGNVGTPGSVILGDLNNDGELDGFVAGCCGMSWSRGSGEKVYTPPISWVWLNEWGPGGFLKRRTLSLKELDGLPVRGAALGDLDGDGSQDVLAAVQEPKPGRDTSPADLVLLNDGAGNLTDSGQRLGESDSSSVALGDLDADGDLDALVGTKDGAVLWVNQGGIQGGQTGVFAPSGQKITGDQTRAVFLADMDGDGDLDALIAGVRQGTIWWNDGLGTFTHSDLRFRYSNRHGLTVGDFDGDSWPDIFAAEYSRDYRVWFNQRDGTFRTAPRP